MKALVINCSPRSKGNTALMLNRVIDVFEKNDITVDYYQLGGKKVRGCTACMACMKIRIMSALLKMKLMNA